MRNRDLELWNPPENDGFIYYDEPDEDYWEACEREADRLEFLQEVSV